MRENKLYQFFFNENPKIGNILIWCSFIIFLFVTLISTLTHEPWIDEIYAWDISKFSISKIFYEMRYEGHFALWSLILFPFSHLGLPLKALGIVSWFINALGVMFFLWKSPFIWWSKISILITLPFLYVNPVISRCYVLIPILVFMLADVFTITQNSTNKIKQDKAFIKIGIILAFLANTHIYTEGFAGIIGIVLLIQTIKDWKTISDKQKKNRILSLSIPVIGAFIAFIQVAPSLFYSSVFTDGENHGSNPIVFLTSSGINSPQALLFSLIIISTIGVYLFQKSKTIFTIVFGSLLYMVILCKFVYGAGVYNRALMWVYFILFGLWISSNKEKEINETSEIKKFYPSILLFTLSIVLFNPTLMIKDFKGLYSGESRFAYFIKDNIDKNTPIFSDPKRWCCVISDYLPSYKFYNLKDQSQLILDADREKIEKEKASDYINNIFKTNPTFDYIYIIDSRHISKSEPTNIIERFNLPFSYDMLYPKTFEQRSYFLQYYLLKVYKYRNTNQENISKETK